MQAADPHLSIDIFCKVVDNYGDIGVCWRLARQLAARPDCGAVRMWVDDLKSFARIAPEVNPGAESQTLGGITLFKWDTTLCELPETVAPADIVVEAF